MNWSKVQVINKIFTTIHNFKYILHINIYINSKYHYVS